MCCHLRARARRLLGAATLATLAPLAALATSCVDAAPRPPAASGTTVVAPATFCAPLRELASDAWTAADRSRAKAELALARESAPEGVQPTLDRLRSLEDRGVHPGAAGASADDVGAWFGAMDELADVAARECLVELAAAPGPDPAPPGTEPSRAGSTGAGSTGAGALDDLVAAVRDAGRGSSWVDRGYAGVVSSGEATQVVVLGVDDPAVALAICEDLVAVAPAGVRPTSVRVRTPAGLVVASNDSGACARDDLQP